MTKQVVFVERISARIGGGKAGERRAQRVVTLFEKLMNIGHDTLVLRREGASKAKGHEGLAHVRKKPRA